MNRSRWIVLLLCGLALALPAVLLRHASERDADGERGERGDRDERRHEREDGADERAELFAQRRLPPGASTIPVERYFAAEQRMRAMPRHFPPSSASTTHSGPLFSAAATVSQWQWLGPANVGGRTRTLAFHPTNPAIMYAGGVSGGVFLSEDAGAHWRPLSDDAVNINIGALAIDPTNPQVIYAGTGELYRNSGMPYSPMAGAGILKSVDGGQSWNRLIATATDDFRYVSDIVLSPHNAQRFYAATNTGIWRSDDAGASFRQLLRPIDASGTLLYEGCNDLSIRSDVDTDWVLAACASRSIADRFYLPGTLLPPSCNGPCPAAVFLNTDAAGGGAFVSVLTEPAQGRTQLSIHRANQNVIYAVAASIVAGFDRTGDQIGDYNNGLDAVFRSQDGGRTWEARVRNSDPSLINTILFQYGSLVNPGLCGQDAPRDFYAAGWYNNAIAADPIDANVVWVAGMNIYRSDDGGHNFGLASYEWTNNETYVHPDHHSLTFHPQFDGVNNRTLYTTNDGGVAATFNARAPVSTGEGAICAPRVAPRVGWNTLVNGLGSTQFYAGAVFPNGSSYLGGTQDNGTWIGSDAGGIAGWRHIYGGDGGVVAIDPGNTQTIYATAQNISLGRSSDGGINFVDAINGLNDNTIFIMPYLIDPNASSRLYAGGTRIWRTDNQANLWRPISTGLGGNAFANRVSALSVAPGNANLILAGNQVGIFRNAQALASTATTVWPSSSPRSGWVSWLAFEPGNPAVVYATYSTFGGVHVWKSTDAGLNWQALDGSGIGALPDVPVHALAVDPGDLRHLYLGTDLGLFVSLDGGAHWAVENTGFANVITEALAVSRPPNGTPQLFAFTYGRGVWRVPLTALTGTPDYRLGGDASGMWFDPNQGGQGFVFEVLNLGGVPQVFASWYTYLNGEQRWLFGVGAVDNNRVHMRLTVVSGASFPPNFVASAVNAQDWGDLDLSFDSARAAHAQWTSSFAGYGNGGMDLIPLTQVLRPSDDPPNAQVRACHSGNWYNTQQSGHGFELQVIAGPEATRQLLATWYVYDQGKPMFLVGNGTIEGDHATLTFGRTHGAQFPPAFHASDVVTEVWGTATFTFSDNDHASVSWTPQVAGFGAGSLALTRLTTLLGHECSASVP